MAVACDNGGKVYVSVQRWNNDICVQMLNVRDGKLWQH